MKDLQEIRSKMKNCLTLRGEDVSVEFNDNELVYTYYNVTSAEGKIPGDAILTSVLNVDGIHGSVDVHFVQKKVDRRLEHGKISFTGPREDCSQINEKITRYMSESKRPKHVLVFINPYSGKKKAKRIYRKHVEKIFRLCNIGAKVIVTKRSKEATDILMDYDLTEIDGVVSVGGDGFYNEVVSGLVKKQQRDNGLDFNNPDAEVLPIAVPIGIVPAGSGNVVAQYINGTICPETAALRVILGKYIKSNVASLHEGKQLSGYSGLVLGFGLFGDMMKDCEKYRWMGPKRYQVIPVGSILKRRTVDVEVSYVLAESEKSDGLSRKCPATHDTIEPERMRKVEGRVFALDTHPIAMTTQGAGMVPRFGEDSLTLYMTEKCSLMKHVNHLTKVRDEKSDCYQYDFISQFKVSRYHVRLHSVELTPEKKLLNGFYISCDGEAIRLSKPEFEVSLHRRVISIFGSLD